MGFEDIWNKSKRQLVLFEKGTFSGRPNKRFIWGTFSLIKTEGGDLFLQPLDTYRVGSATDSALLNDAVDDAFALSQEEFYLDSDVLVMDPCLMGAYDGPDNWMACHQFSNI
jgi:hypothetical protein